MLVRHDQREVPDESAIAAALGQSRKNVEGVGVGREGGTEERSRLVERKNRVTCIR
jgi:hypothetical protein